MVNATSIASQEGPRKHLNLLVEHSTSSGGDNKPGRICGGRLGGACYMMTNFVDAPRANTIEFREMGTTPLILRGVALSIAIISVNTIISAACPVTAFPY